VKRRQQWEFDAVEVIQKSTVWELLRGPTFYKREYWLTEELTEKETCIIVTQKLIKLQAVI
jgi:hypothetical protein